MKAIVKNAMVKFLFGAGGFMIAILLERFVVLNFM